MIEGLLEVMGVGRELVGGVITHTLVKRCTLTGFDTVGDLIEILNILHCCHAAEENAGTDGLVHPMLSLPGKIDDIW